MTPDEIALSLSSSGNLVSALPLAAGSSPVRHEGSGGWSSASSGPVGEAACTTGSAPVWERAAQYKAKGQRKMGVTKAAVLAAEEAETKVRPQLTAAAKHKIRTTDDLAKWALQRKRPLALSASADTACAAPGAWPFRNGDAPLWVRNQRACPSGKKTQTLPFTLLCRRRQAHRGAEEAMGRGREGRQPAAHHLPTQPCPGSQSRSSLATDLASSNDLANDLTSKPVFIC